MSRILITGLGHYWGAKLAQILEADPSVEVLVGVDRRPPRVELERTEFVRVPEHYGPLRRIVEVAEIDTILHTHMTVDSTMMSSRSLRELNVIGTMNLLAAATDSSVRRVVVKSSTVAYGAGRGDPQFFREDSPRSKATTTPLEGSLLEAEEYVRDFAQDNPHVLVTLYRCANVLGVDRETSLQQALSMPAIPAVFGFDPLVQVVHVDDCAAALAYAVNHDIPGIYNVVADGMIPWSEARTIFAKPPLFLPPYGADLVALGLKTARIVDLPPELLRMLRFGRGVDGDRLREAGFEYTYDTVQTFHEYAGRLRLERVVGSDRPEEPRWQEDVENFLLRHAGEHH